MNVKKSIDKLKELELDLIEIMAYRDLQDESFCFDGVNEIKNESKYSEDAYYRIALNNIVNNIENYTLTKKRKKVFKNNKHNY